MVNSRMLNKREAGELEARKRRIEKGARMTFRGLRVMECNREKRIAFLRDLKAVYQKALELELVSKGESLR